MWGIWLILLLIICYNNEFFHYIFILGIKSEPNGSIKAYIIYIFKIMSILIYRLK